MLTKRLPTLVRHIDTVASYGMLVAGIIHTSLTPLFNTTFGINELWFAGTGLAFGFLGCLNLVRRTIDSTSVWWLCLSANVVGTGYMGLVVAMIPAPHVYLVFAFISAATLTTILTPAHRPQPLNNYHPG